MQTIINKLYEQQGLTQAESQQLFDQIIRGEMDPVLMAAVLTALKIKGETPDEIAGAAKARSPTPIHFRVLITTLPISSVPVAMAQTPSTSQPPPHLSPQRVA